MGPLDDLPSMDTSSQVLGYGSTDTHPGHHHVHMTTQPYDQVWMHTTPTSRYAWPHNQHRCGHMPHTPAHTHVTHVRLMHATLTTALLMALGGKALIWCLFV